MTLPLYDPEVHHLGLGEDASSLTGLICAGPITKERATPIFEKPSNIGTDDLIGSSSRSNWTQSDYSGGEFQEDWADAAMFAECVGMLPNQLGRTIRTTRPITEAYLGHPDLMTTPVSADVIDGVSFLVWNNASGAAVVRLDPADLANPRTEQISNTYLPAGKTVLGAKWNFSGTRVWITTNEPQIHTFTWDNTAAAGSRLVHKATYDPPTYSADPVQTVRNAHLFGAMKFIFTGHGGGTIDDNRAWLYVSGNGSSTKWKLVGPLAGQYVTSITYNSAVYILCRNGKDRTFLMMTQGDQVFPVVEIPYFFSGQSMIEYAGRLFIGGVGYDLDGNAGHGELYEVNGASIRLVRTFAPEVARPDSPVEDSKDAQIGRIPKGNYPGPGGGGNVSGPGVKPIRRRRRMTQLADLAVAEGLLWMPDSSYSGLEVYDATTDSFYGAGRVRFGVQDDFEFTKLWAVGNSVFAYATTPDGLLQGVYRTEHAADDDDDYISYLTTSDFSPEPGRFKIWSEFLTISRGVAPTLEYSFDSGYSWTTVSATSTTTHGDKQERVFDLSAVPSSRAIRFRITFNLSGAPASKSAELVAHSLGFLVRGETKHRWHCTVAASSGIADLGNELVHQDAQAIVTRLEALASTTEPLTLRDVDGTDHQVIVSTITRNNVVLTEDREAYLPLVLTEV